MRCYVQECDRDAVTLLTISDGWCPKGPECPGHPYCAVCAVSFRRRSTAERSLAGASLGEPEETK